MPNHIRNRLTVNGSPEKVKAVFEFIKGSELAIDFNTIVPMPKSLNVSSSSDSEMAWCAIYKRSTRYLSTSAALERFNAASITEQESLKKLAAEYEFNFVTYGSNSWYDWSIANWGTKWNAYEQSIISDNQIEFDTAWAAVPNLIKNLGDKFKEVSFEYIWADEDTGSNAGEMTIEKGVSDINYLDGNEAYEMAFELRPYLEDDYKLIDGEYKYVELED